MSVHKFKNKGESSGLTLRHAAGEGRPLVIVHERGCYAHEGDEIASLLSRGAQVSLLEIGAASDTAQDSRFAALRKWLVVQGLKQASFVALGRAGGVIGRLSAQSPRLVRSMVMVDCSIAPPERIRPFLHRIRCPVLLVFTPKATDSIRRECHEMSERMPSARYEELPRETTAALADVIGDFQRVPARCPQKRLQEMREQDKQRDEPENRFQNNDE